MRHADDDFNSSFVNKLIGMEMSFCVVIAHYRKSVASDGHDDMRQTLHSHYVKLLKTLDKLAMLAMETITEQHDIHAFVEGAKYLSDFKYSSTNGITSNLTKAHLMVCTFVERNLGKLYLDEDLQNTCLDIINEHRAMWKDMLFLRDQH